MTIYVLNLTLIVFWGIIFRKYKPTEKLFSSSLGTDNLKWGKWSINVKNLSLDNLLLCLLIGTQLFFILAFRINTGIDVKTYKEIFSQIAEKDIVNLFSYKLEQGFVLLNALIALLTNNFQWILIISAFITILCLSIAIYKYSKYIYLSYLLYTTFFFYFTITGIRQGIALSITLLGMNFLKRRNFTKYAIVILIAMLFHYSAIIMLPVFFIANMNLNLKKILVLSSITLTLYLFIDKLFMLAASIIPKYAGTYTTEEGISLYGTGQSWKSMIICVFIFLLLSIFYKKIIKLNETNKIYFNISFCSVLVSLFQTKINVLDRFPYYLNLYIIFSLPLLIDCFDMKFINKIIKFLPSKIKIYLENRLTDRILRQSITVLIVIFSFLYSFYVFSNNYYGILPYRNIFLAY